MIGKIIKKDNIAFIFVTVLTIIALCYGFSTIPSAGAEQAVIADQQRVVDLGELQSSIDTYFQTNSKLPATLDQLTSNTDDPNEPLEKTDPLTKNEYYYKIFDGYAGTFELCATFTQKSPKTYNDIGVFAFSTYSQYADSFPHPAGYHCFNENVNGAVSPSPSGGIDMLGSPAPTAFPYPSSGTVPGNGGPGPSYETPTPMPPNPQQNDAKRNGDVNAILNAIDQFTADNTGALPSEIASLPVNTPIEINSINFPTLCNQLVPTYLSALPVDPSISTNISPNNQEGISSCSVSSWATGYEISKTSSNQLTVSAPEAETGNIDVSR